MQAEIGLAIILIIVLLADLFQKALLRKHATAFMRIACYSATQQPIQFCQWRSFRKHVYQYSHDICSKNSPHIRNNTGIHAGRHMAGTRRHTS